MAEKAVLSQKQGKRVDREFEGSVPGEAGQGILREWRTRPGGVFRNHVHWFPDAADGIVNPQSGRKPRGRRCQEDQARAQPPAAVQDKAQHGRDQ